MLASSGARSAMKAWLPRADRVQAMYVYCAVVKPVEGSSDHGIWALTVSPKILMSEGSRRVTTGGLKAEAKVTTLPLPS